MSSRYQNLAGIITRLIPTKDADVVVYLLDRNGQQQTLIAKGVRKPKSRKAHAIDLLNQVEVKLAEGGNMPLITEIKLVSNARQFKQDYKLLMFTQLICEIVQEFSKEGSEEPGIYNNLVNLLSIESPTKLKLLLAGLILRYLSCTGHLPRLDQDIFSGSDIIEGELRFPSSEIGYTNTQKSQMLEPVSDRLYKVQKFILRSDFGQMQQLGLTDAEQAQLFSLHIYWLETLLDKQPKTLNLFLEASNS